VPGRHPVGVGGGRPQAGQLVAGLRGRTDQHRPVAVHLVDVVSGQSAAAVVGGGAPRQNRSGGGDVGGGQVGRGARRVVGGRGAEDGVAAALGDVARVVPGHDVGGVGGRGLQAGQLVAGLRGRAHQPFLAVEQVDVVSGQSAAAGVGGGGPGQHGAGGGGVLDRREAGSARRGPVLTGFLPRVLTGLRDVAPHGFARVVEHDVGGGGEFVADPLEGPVVGGVPALAAGDAELHLAAVLGLAAGEDLLAGAVDLHVVQVAGDVVDAVGGGALVVGGGDRDPVGVDALVQGEPVPEGALVQHPGGPGRAVADHRLDLGERGARGVDLGLDEHLGPVGLLLGREVRQRGAAVLGDQHGQGAGEAGVVEIGRASWRERVES